MHKGRTAVGSYISIVGSFFLIEVLLGGGKIVQYKRDGNDSRRRAEGEHFSSVSLFVGLGHFTSPITGQDEVTWGSKAFGKPRILRAGNTGSPTEPCTSPGGFGGREIS